MICSFHLILWKNRKHFKNVSESRRENNVLLLYEVLFSPASSAQRFFYFYSPLYICLLWLKETWCFINKNISLILVLSIILTYPLNSLVPSNIHQSGILSVHLGQYKYHFVRMWNFFFLAKQEKAQDRWVKKKVRHTIRCQKREKK